MIVHTHTKQPYHHLMWAVPRSSVATVPLKMFLTPPSLYSFTAQSMLLAYLAAAFDSLWICIKHLILSPGADTTVVKIPDSPPARICWVILFRRWSGRGEGGGGGRQGDLWHCNAVEAQTCAVDIFLLTEIQQWSRSDDSETLNNR